MKVYLVRHGQSVANFEERHSGWTQLPLTEKGFEDARRAGARLAGISFDRIYSSDLRRAIQTAQTALPGCEPIQLPVLRERNVGSLIERLFVDCAAEYGEKYWDTRRTLDYTPFGGEDIPMFNVRTAEFFHMLEADPCNAVAVFTHYGFIQNAVEYVLGAPIERRRLAFSNGSVTVVEYIDNYWRLVS